MKSGRAESKPLRGKRTGSKSRHAGPAAVPVSASPERRPRGYPLIGVIILDERGVVEALNPAAAQLFGSSPNAIIGQNISVLMAIAARKGNEGFLTPFLRASDDGIPGVKRNVLGRHEDGRGIQLDVTLEEFHLGARKMFVVMAQDVSAHKRLQRELLEGGERERQRLGHDLHDGLGQHLHALYYRATLLQKDLQEDASPRAREAAELSKFLHEAIELARSLARGLQPVHPVPEGLMTALRELARRTRALYRVDCRWECRTPVLVHQHSTATHLYRIAQEAVNNAMKHAHPTHLCIRLATIPGKILLGIRDNGRGLRRNPRSKGIGLQVMQFRADAIQGSLVLQRPPSGGTEVVCTVHRESELPPNSKSK
jgi:PAS domain S-box-containing protein